MLEILCLTSTFFRVICKSRGSLMAVGANPGSHLRAFRNLYMKFNLYFTVICSWKETTVRKLAHLNYSPALILGGKTSAQLWDELADDV